MTFLRCFYFLFKLEVGQLGLWLLEGCLSWKTWKSCSLRPEVSNPLKSRYLGSICGCPILHMIGNMWLNQITMFWEASTVRYLFKLLRHRSDTVSFREHTYGVARSLVALAPSTRWSTTVDTRATTTNGQLTETRAGLTKNACPTSGNRRTWEIHSWWTVCEVTWPQKTSGKVQSLTPDPKFGRGGPMAVEEGRHSTTLRETFLEAGRFLGYKVTHDQQDGKESFAPVNFQIKDGKRWTTSQGYLLPAIKQRSNIHIALRSQVHKILFHDPIDRKRATGVRVEFRGRIVDIQARREVILSAGTIGSPHLLMLSGIGPADHLKALEVHFFS